MQEQVQKEPQEQELLLNHENDLDTRARTREWSKHKDQSFSFYLCLFLYLLWTTFFLWKQDMRKGQGVILSYFLSTGIKAIIPGLFVGIT